MGYNGHGQPVICWRPEGGGGHGRPIEGRHPPQSGPVAGGDSRHHPRWPLRQHRPRLHTRASATRGRPAAGGLCGNGGGLRRRPGRREVPGYQVPRRPGLRAVAAVVIVATVRALKHHGWLPQDPAGHGGSRRPCARGLPNLLQARREHHAGLRPARRGGPQPASPATTDGKELALVREACGGYGVRVALSEVWGKGGGGGVELACGVLRALERENRFRFAYDAALSHPGQAAGPDPKCLRAAACWPIPRRPTGRSTA